MNFKVSRMPLLNELNKVARAVSAKTPLPSLSGIKIEAKNNALYFTGSDSDISIHSSMVNTNDEFVLQILEEGSIVIGAKYILEIVRKIESSEITIEVIDGALIEIRGMSSEFKVNGLRVTDYPIIDFTKPEKSFFMDADQLKRTINQTIFATSDKETRPVLTGVNVKCEKNRIEFVATDSYRLARKIIDFPENFSFNVTIPAKSLNEVARTIEKDTKIEIAVSDKKAQFWIDNTVIQTRLIEGAYPETSRLIPMNFDYELVVDARDLLNAIDRASLMKNDGINVVRLSMSSEKVELFSRSQEVGSVNEVMDEASFEGDALNISFSGRYAMDAIKATSSSLVKVMFSGEMKPFIIRGVDDEQLVQLILPVRTYA